MSNTAIFIGVGVLGALVIGGGLYLALKSDPAPPPQQFQQYTPPAPIVQQDAATATIDGIARLGVAALNGFVGNRNERDAAQLAQRRLDDAAQSRRELLAHCAAYPQSALCRAGIPAAEGGASQPPAART